MLARMRRRKSTPVIGRKKQTQYLLKVTVSSKGWPEELCGEVTENASWIEM